MKYPETPMIWDLRAYVTYTYVHACRTIVLEHWVSLILLYFSNKLKYKDEFFDNVNWILYAQYDEYIEYGYSFSIAYAKPPFSNILVLITLFLSIILCSFAALDCTSFCAQVGEQVYAHAEWLYSLIKHIIPQLKERFSLLFFMLRWRTFLPYWF